MIDNFSGIDFFFLKDRAILHNTWDGSGFYVPYLLQATCNFRERTWALDRVGGGRGGIPWAHYLSITKPA